MKIWKLFVVGALCLCFNNPLHSQDSLNISSLGKFSYTNRVVSGDLSDIWGYVDAQGSEYAIVGLENGVSIVDVTQPSNMVEIFSQTGVNTIWRDIKTYNHYAYVTNEGSGGLMIIDLSSLPSAPQPSDVTYFTGINYPFNTAHNLYIDEQGIAYIFGSDYGNGGAILLDVTATNGQPQELGVFDTYYLHDGMARNDTLWGSAINNGHFLAIDVSNRNNPTILGSHVTPGYYTHNSWISDNGKVVFTTDELAWGKIASYNVEDINNIYQLDEIQSTEGTSTIPHNVHVKENFLVISYYHDGVYIVDATFPDNMLVVGYYDTSPNYSNDGFNGCWGVYPWLPSGNIIASDVNEGLYVLSASYKQAAYLKGTVTDFDNNQIITSASVHITAINDTLKSNLLGQYETAIFDSANYQLVFSAEGYRNDTMIVLLSYGQTTVADVALRGIHSSIEQNERDNEVIIYPNPAKEKLYVEANVMPGQFINYRIIDITGKAIQTGRINPVSNVVEIDTPEQQGTYTIEISLPGGFRSYSKFVRE